MSEVLKASYVSYAQLDSIPAPRDRVLGIAAFGAEPPPSDALAGVAGVWVDTPALGSPGWYEVWQSGEPVQPFEHRGIRGAANEHVLFGCVQVAEDHGLEHAARRAYEAVFDATDALGFPHLLRAWNYFSRINTDADGIERYRRFNSGRHDAFAARDRANGADMPAACALGSRRGPLTVYFIAAKARGAAVENPRQMSAYRYPERYGARSPSFSRAMLMPLNGRRAVAISGTASIVGHETLHAGDTAAQVEETLNNIEALLAEAGCGPAVSADAGAGLLLKAYVRRPADLGIVENAVARRFARAGVIYLQADICRSDLLVEIEGFYGPRSEVR